MARYVENTSSERPHLVLLGAGASRAGFPDGDANGLQLPLMQDLPRVCGLETQLQDAGIETSANFETIYEQISSRAETVVLAERIQNQIREYFSQMQLPSEPTLYDLLILSLRPKDVVATFNWDPLLFQAWKRNQERSNHRTPDLLFLHGTVALFCCPICEEPVVLGSPGSSCKGCNSKLEPMRLLFPIGGKDYTEDRSIRAAWRLMDWSMKNAYVFTTFGYAAPDSDAAAMELLRAGWGPNKHKRGYEQVEIINIETKMQALAKWDPFIVGSHYDYVQCFEDSWAYNFPRRGCEAVFGRTMDMDEDSGTPWPKDLTWDSIDDFLAPLLAAENAAVDR